LAEQRRVVARIEALVANIDEVRSLLHGVRDDMEMLLVCMAHRRDLDETTKKSTGWRHVPLGDCIRLVDESHRVDPDQSYLNFGIYSFGKGLFPKPPIRGVATSATTLRRVKAGQFVYSRLFAFEGAYGMVAREHDGYFVSGEYPTFECDPQAVLVEFLVSYFKAPPVWKEVAMGSKGLGDRRQRVQPAQILGHTVWVPPLEWQYTLAAVQAQVNSLKDPQAETAAELDALLPSILDRAFKGEL
jgi:type I restriction enzyme S subunit